MSSPQALFPSEHTIYKTTCTHFKILYLCHHYHHRCYTFLLSAQYTAQDPKNDKQVADMLILKCRCIPTHIRAIARGTPKCSHYEHHLSHLCCGHHG